MKNVGLIITIIGLISALFCIGGFVSASYGSDADYRICLNRCYLDLPKVEECVDAEKQYWDTDNTTDLQIKRNCKEMIKYEKINCYINCVSDDIKVEDRATRYYDTNVKNFPLTNQ